MKTSITSLIITVLTTISLSIATSEAKASEQNTVTVLNTVKNVRDIVVSGNVDLILVQKQVESVKVYDKYYSKNALIQQQDGVLRISSYAKERLTIIAYVNAISSIEASENAKVTTHGTFNLLSLNVILRDDAQADINASTINLTTSVNDRAKLNLAGNAIDYAGKMSAMAKVTMDQFTADCSSIRSVAPVYSAKIVLAKEDADDMILQP
ncbi:MAG: hypothetical protein EOP48_04780 [Sphingobacteriales bacterium]|nr:MAG: hypothetical protein EOP48_04780 [Sphingobacteriales bacterium]